jgi:hypothetical protein
MAHPTKPGKTAGCTERNEVVVKQDTNKGLDQSQKKRFKTLKNCLFVVIVQAVIESGFPRLASRFMGGRFSF